MRRASWKNIAESFSVYMLLQQVNKNVVTYNTKRSMMLRTQTTQILYFWEFFVFLCKGQANVGKHNF